MKLAAVLGVSLGLVAVSALARADANVTLTAAPIDARACPDGADVDAKIALAECHAHAGRTASAYAAFESAMAIAKSSGDKRRSALAQQREALEPHLSKLIVVLDAPAHVPGIAITRDGAPMEPTELGRWVPVDPGVHSVRVTAPARRPWEATVRVAPEGGMETITIPVLESEAMAPLPVDAAANEGHGQRMIGLATGATGLAVLGVGAIFGLNAEANRRDSASHCTPSPDSRCDDEGLRLRDSLRTNATVATASFVGGLLLVATGTALYFTAPKGTTRVGVSPSVGPQARGFVLHGAF